MPRKYGWKKDVREKGNLLCALPSPSSVAALPPVFSLRPGFPACYDQGNTSSCTGNGVAGALEFKRRQLKLTDFIPSRLFIYWGGRALEGDTNSDSGARIEDVVDALGETGYCDEKLWPFVEDQVCAKPSAPASAAAHNDIVTQRLVLTQNAGVFKHAIFSQDPIVCGIMVYDGLESDTAAKTGIVPMPSDSDSLMGGHCVVCVGWDDKKGMWEMRNSWGPDWGDHGYFWLPYEYLLDSSLASDFTIITAA